jgi:hypothetical protein
VLILDRNVDRRWSTLCFSPLTVTLNIAGRRAGLIAPVLSKPPADWRQPSGTLRAIALSYRTCCLRCRNQRSALSRPTCTKSAVQDWQSEPCRPLSGRLSRRKFNPSDSVPPTVISHTLPVGGLRVSRSRPKPACAADTDSRGSLSAKPPEPPVQRQSFGPMPQSRCRRLWHSTGRRSSRLREGRCSTWHQAQHSHCPWSPSVFGSHCFWLAA